MADYEKSKGRSLYPDNATETSWNRLEPLITAEDVRVGHLFGIPLYSGIRDPKTGVAQEMTDPLITKLIERAVSLAEDDCNIDILPVQHSVRMEFDQQHYQSFGYSKLPHRPVSSVQSLKVVPSNGVAVYDVPLEWIDVGGLTWGQLNIVPLTIGTNASGYQPVQSAGGAVFLSIFANRQYMPFFWEVTYTTGFPDGKLPKTINELIGTVAAMEILSMLAATYARSSSTSLGLDGLSQSVSGPGPQIYVQRIQELAEKRKKLVKRVKMRYGVTMFSGNV